MGMNSQSRNLNTQKTTVRLAKMGILVAISVVLVVFRVPMPNAPFLEYDPADIPILIGTFAFGPLAGFILTVTTSVIQGLTVSAQSGPYGIIMHIIATGTFVIVAGNIYRRIQTKKGTAIAIIAGALSLVIIMIPANLLVVPLFMGMPREAVTVLMIPAIIPFNLIKAGLNGLVTFLLYKRISPFLHK